MNRSFIRRVSQTGDEAKPERQFSSAAEQFFVAPEFDRMGLEADDQIGHDFTDNGHATVGIPGFEVGYRAQSDSGESPEQDSRDNPYGYCATDQVENADDRRPLFR